MTATYYKRVFSVPTGSNTAAVVENLPVKGHLTAVNVGTDGTAQGPGYAAVYFGTQTGGNLFIGIAFGTVRGDANFPGDDGLYWTGSISLDTNLGVPILAFDFRNDTGSTMPFAVTYCVEDR